MYLPSVSLILCGLFIAYIGHSIWTIYSLFTPPVCKPNEECLHPYMQNNPKLMLALFSSTKKTISSASELSLLREWDDVDIHKSFELSINVTLPRSTINNGSLYVHAFLIPKFQTSQTAAHLVSSPYAYYTSAPLTAHVIPVAETYQLLGQADHCKDGENCLKDKPEQLPKVKSRPVTHWRNNLHLGVMNEMISIPSKQIPVEFFKYIRLSPQRQYLPVLYIDILSSRVRDFKLLSQTTNKMELQIYFAPVSFGKLRLCNQVEAALETMVSLGFTENDLDEIKGIFMDTNLWLLCLTFAVAALHLLFDFLAFKNDILFWHRRKTTVGLSTRSLIWRCVSHVIIFVSLMDEDTSLLVVIPAGIGTLIEMWKMMKVFKVSISFNRWLPRIQIGTTTEAEQKTELYDAQSMKYLLWLLLPLCLGGAAYSLLYLPHKGWYSWCVQSLVHGVYAFGFLFMLPQLFVNYKHKSVAHLPWRAFMYKAFNTFIDDIFAFIITMPVAHRVACFRDDVVFLIYLYQRWLYPVDKLRVNEFGEAFADNELEDSAKVKKNK